VALGGLDERSDVPDEQPVTVPGERRHEVERHPAVTLLATKVVGERLIQRRGVVRCRADELVVRVERVGDEALAAAHPVVDAEQADEVGAVAVEPERVAADLVAALALSRRLPFVIVVILASATTAIVRLIT